MASDNRDGWKPSVSVIIPAKNAAATIGEQLTALAAQSFDGDWEVIVADNGSSDATVDVVNSFIGKLPGLKVIDASEIKGSSYARNRAAEIADGSLLCFCDADDVVNPGWLAALATGGKQFEIAGGRLETESLNDPWVRSWRPTPAAETAVDKIPFAPSGNMVIRSETFRELGGFDEEFLKSHDVELSRRAQTAGYEIGFCHDAVVSYRLRSGLREVARQAFRSGRAGAQACAQGDGAQRSLRVSMRDWLWLVVRVPTLANRVRRGIWVRRASEAVGRVAGSVRWRVRYL